MPNGVEGPFQRHGSLSSIRRSSRGSRAAPSAFNRSSVLVPWQLHVHRRRSSCSSCPSRYDKSRIRRLSPQQGSMHCDARSHLLGLEQRALGRHPQHSACLFPSLYLDHDIVHHPFSSSSQCSLYQLSSTQRTFWNIVSFYCNIRHCNSNCGSSSNDLSLSPILFMMSSCSCSQPSRIIIPSFFSTQWAALEASIL